MEYGKLNLDLSQPHQNGLAIRGFRENAQMTVQDLADFVGITAPHMRNIENEHRDASDAHMERISRAVGRPVGAMIRWPRVDSESQQVAS